MSYKLIEYTARKFLSHSNSKQNTREEKFIYEQTVVSFFSIINNIIIKLNELWELYSDAQFTDLYGIIVFRMIFQTENLKLSTSPVL